MGHTEGRLSKQAKKRAKRVRLEDGRSGERNRKGWTREGRNEGRVRNRICVGEENIKKRWGIGREGREKEGAKKG